MYKYQLTLVFVLLISASNTLACSCANFTLYLKWDISKNVFLASITHTEAISPYGFKGYFTVKEVFKGSAEVVPYFDITDTTLCSQNVKQGESYIVFAPEDGPIEYDMCSLTTRSLNAPYYTEVLRKLSSNIPPIIFSGLYNSETDEVYIYSDGNTYQVIDLELYEHEKYEVEFKGYKLHDGNLFALDVLKKTPANE